MKNKILSKENIKKELVNINQINDYIEVCFYDEIDSTNDEAKRIFKNNAITYPLLITALSQTKGKGRMGKSFYSPKNSGVYFSLGLKSISKNLSDMVNTTALIALATIYALNELSNQEFKIKWVNDIYLKDKKICGILVESLINENNEIDIVIGIGININTNNFPGDLIKKATSINEDINKNILIAKIVNNILTILKNNKDKKYLSEYKKYSLVLGSNIKYVNNNILANAFVVDIDDSFSLIVKKETGEIIKLSNGEISIVQN